MKKFLIDNGVKFEGDYIKLPNKCKRIKIDIGAGAYANNSKVWLDKEHNMYDNLVVFVFEPNPLSVKILKNSKEKANKKLDLSINKNEVFVLPCALGNPGPSDTNIRTLYYDDNINKDDDLQKRYDILDKSSTLEYKSGYKRITVSYYTLNEFISYINPLNIKVIDYVKIDTNKSDLNVLLGANLVLNRIAILTFASLNDEKKEYESDDEDDSYYKNDVLNNNYYDIVEYLKKNDFAENPPKYMNSFNINPTLYNKKLESYIKTNFVTYYQIPSYFN